ncbi:MAG: hypothetical protein HFE84_05115 [Lachnospiraceae bacterium]|nr:hypothetical protein [Lachnospiraceae bacterium]
MTWTPITAFAVVVLCFAIGDILAIKTKGLISSFIFTILMIMIFGATLHILPENLIEIAGLSNILVTYGIVLTFVNIGSNLKFNELVAEWKTIVVSLGAMAAVMLMGFTLGTLLFGREYALSSIGTICGGLGSTLVTSDLATKAGRQDIAVFVTTMMTFQSLVGILISSVCLNRACGRYIATGRIKQEETSKAKVFNIKLIPDFPPIAQSAMMSFARLAVVGVIGEAFSKFTGLNSTVCYLLFGFLLTEIGLLERGSLKKSGGESIVLLGSYAYLLINFLSLTFTELLQMMVPILGLLLIGAIIAALAAVLVGMFLKWDPWLSAAVGVTCLLGYPFTYGIAMEAVNGNTFGKDFTDEEIQRLTNYVLPKMVIGGVISVSIVSVIIAAYIGPMIFR